ncbi:AraC family transcriptional regulator [Novosphingobium sp.]|uniref:AraC family transcriptional regulator n=1 Tax=Novosphingobium sp. TaxID=1874826 RepID=UPI002733961E|nr:AraC family transcriptional regulator [Novosphingobium sp.]MDP3908627.1 AraC family transcriptional regulator ligand-binding domain-containing protein [Novosphingobium sp.]
MVRWVRSGVLEVAPELVAELGGDYRALARKAGAPLRPLANPDLPMRVEGVVALLELAAGKLAEPAFGLRLGLRQSLSLFGAMAPLLNSAATVDELLGDLVDYFPLHTQGTIVGLHKEAAGTLLTYELAADTVGYQRHVIELGFGVIIREIRRHMPDWRPETLYLRHSPPPDRSWHRRLLGEHVVFNADRNAMLLDPVLLAMRTVEGDHAIHDSLAARFGDAARLAPGLDGLRTEALVRAMLPFAPINLAIAARLLRLSRRTLQRRLTECGTSYEVILDQVRAGLARSYLAESDLSVAEIAEILQYSETSALTRAVRRWSGLSPRAIRRTHRDRLAR